MNRRKAVQHVALLLGGSVLGAEMFIQSGCNPIDTKKVAEAPVTTFFSEVEIELLDEITETIIPRTDTPGAKDAKVAEFMNVMVRDCYTKEDQKIFKEGLKKLQQQCKEKYRADFMRVNADQKKEFINLVNREELDYNKNKKKGDPKHYFRMLRELTLLGFFTSEPGATKVLRYVSVPGKYEPCIPYTKGEKAWATS